MTILLIENDNRHAALLCTALKAIDSAIECITSTDTEKALALLHDSQHLPQLILVDLMMPGMNGLQFYYAVKEHSSLKAIPVWLTSSNIKENDIDFFERAGIKIFTKQSLQNNLITAVESILIAHQSKPLSLPEHDTGNDLLTMKSLQLQFSWK
jgi:DNA-binding response OmpR family regulator